MKRVLALAVFIGLLAFPAFAGPGLYEIRPDVVKITEQTVDKTVNLEVGGEFLVEVEAQLGTGYDWTFTAPGLVQVVAMDTHGNSGSNIMIQQWQFLAKSPGEGTITFTYSRPWQPNKPDKSFTVKVEVAEHH